ncbi:5'-methylthioadenosine/adenosylhomocysteine nucleosidase [Lacticaseibacillus pabuli]|uniref:5'-methylthioadenosine/S-adenosylhomocysteine nucleosidase n=1 Tax=Lacticaseibacillus pabuli TaxID=3025672 RepID=A0ABY7WN96_9LACO|nr:5'-methylthioadenosine/adenosylhomocysteine nucleosidase [Lacticaseibacillus sp. KACC 23028]WDF81659.1 5'-methylthioadenosine/adenosylhomocysteine nucleosidase [Lacticaseibacillus sp. KACC 23028]
MKIGVVCAMEEEIRELLAVLDNQKSVTIAGQKFYDGTINGQEVSLVECGIGKVQAGMNTALLIDTYHPDLVINTGSAGGIGDGLKVGDVVISSGVAYHDVDSTAFGYLPGQLPQRPQIFKADEKYVQLIKQAAEKTDLTTHVGLIATGDQFVASADQIAKIKQIYPDALASEMEGAAIGQVCTQFGMPFVVIRAMSDVGDENASVSFDDFIIDAGKRSAAMFLEFLKEIAA